MKTIYLAYWIQQFPEPETSTRSFVWIGDTCDPNTRHSRIYKSQDYAKMLALANKMAAEHELSLTHISLDLTWETIYTKPASQMQQKSPKAWVHCS